MRSGLSKSQPLAPLTGLPHAWSQRAELVQRELSNRGRREAAHLRCGQRGKLRCTDRAELAFAERAQLDAGDAAPLRGRKRRQRGRLESANRRHGELRQLARRQNADLSG